MSAGNQHTLRYADRGDVEKLVASLPTWQRDQMLTLSQDQDLSTYVKILLEGAVPMVTPPAIYQGSVEAKIQQYTVEFKIYLGNKEKIAKRHGRFIALMLKSCDFELRAHIEQSRQFQSHMESIPINILGAYNLILEKAIYEPVHLSGLRINCEAYVRNIKMKPWESVQQFIRRFNDTQSFGIKHLGMVAIDDSTLRNVFMSALKEVPSVHPFWTLETVKSDDDAALTLNDLQDRLEGWAILLDINPKRSEKARSTRSTYETTEHTLVTQHLPPSTRGGKNQQRAKPAYTGPKDQSRYDARIAHGLTNKSHGFQGRGNNYSAPTNPNRSYEERNHQPPRNARNGAKPQRDYSNQRTTVNGWEENPSQNRFKQTQNQHQHPRSQNSPNRAPMMSNYSRDPRGGGKKVSETRSFFTDNTHGDQCYLLERDITFDGYSDGPIDNTVSEVTNETDYYSADEDQEPEQYKNRSATAGWPSDEENRRKTVENSTRLEIPNSTRLGFTNPENYAFVTSTAKRDNPRDGDPRARTALDSACTFHLVNDAIPRTLMTGDSYDRGTFKVQTLFGGPAELPLITEQHVIGVVCNHVAQAPMSLLSMSGLMKTHTLETNVENVLRFTAKEDHPIKSSVVFMNDGTGLYILDSITMWDEPVIQCPHAKKATWERLSGQWKKIEVACMSYTLTETLPGAMAYDHSPLMEQSYMDAVSKGEPYSIFTKRQIAQAAEVKTLKLSLRGISDGQLRFMLANNRIKGCNLTPQDVDVARKHFGNPDLKGKLTETKQQIQVSPMAYMNSGQICEIFADLMQLTRTSLFLVAVVMPFHFVMQVPLESTSSKAIQAAFVILLGFIRSYNHCPRVLYFDLQSGINPLQSWFLQQQILLISTNAKTHVQRAERVIRRLKEHLRVVIQTARMLTPKRFYKLLVQSTVRILNYEVSTGSESGTSCPAMLFGLPALIYSNLFPWMEYGDVPAPISVVSNSVFRSRTERALCLAAHPSSMGVQVYLLETKRFATRDRFIPQPLTTDGWNLMQQLLDEDDEMPDLLKLPVHSNAVDDDAVGGRGGEDGLAGDAPNDVQTVQTNDVSVELQEVPETAPEPLVVPISVPARPKKNTKSDKDPWIDPKNAVNDLHDDWSESKNGKGRYRFEEVDPYANTNSEPIETSKVVDGQRRSLRTHTAPEVALYVIQDSSNLSKTTTQAEKDKARTSEIRQIIEKETLCPIMTPKPGTDEYFHVMDRLLSLFMIEKEKFNSDGSHNKFKYRYVLNGNPQSAAGYDAKTLSSPTPSDCIIFLFIAIAAHLRWALSVIDVAGAFLNSFLLKGSNIYARIDKKQVPLVLQIRPDWKRFVNNRGEIICKVQKGLYGLREAPLLWSRHLKDTLVNEAGYVQNKKETCVYTRGCGLIMTILIIFVDDILIISKNNDEFVRLQGILRGKYGKITTQSGNKLDYLGMEVSTVPGGFDVTQIGSIEKLLDEHDIKGTKPTPSNANFTDVFPESEALPVAEFTVFRSTVMLLLYIARRTRPDILFQISWFTSRMHAATFQDMAKLHHLLKYLNGTRKIGLRLVPRESESGLMAMIDSSHGLHLSGHGHWALTLFFYGMCVLCVSRKLKLVGRSSCESEMLGVNEGGVYVLFIRELLSSLGIAVYGPTLILQDNESAIGIMTGEHKIAMSSKHIHLRNLWIMDYVKWSEFAFEHRKTKFMTADLLGKGLVGHLFKRHRYGVMNWPGLMPADDEKFMFALNRQSLEMVKSMKEG